MNCTRCGGTGFLNAEQIPAHVDASDIQAVIEFIVDTPERNCSCHTGAPCGNCMQQHDVRVCDCCGDGEGHYGEPGQHTIIGSKITPAGRFAVWDCDRVPECI